MLRSRRRQRNSGNVFMKAAISEGVGAAPPAAQSAYDRGNPAANSPGPTGVACVGGPTSLRFLKTLMFYAHSVVSLGIVLTSWRLVQGQPHSTLMLAGQLAFVGIFFYAIATLKDMSHLAYPSGLLFVFFYLAYFVKSFVYLIDPELFFRTWVTQRSPMAYATFGDWASAVTLAALATGLFGFGYMLVGALGVGRRTFPLLDARHEHGFVMWVMLALGAAYLLLRVFVTQYLKMGAFNSESRLLLIPGLSGFLQMTSLWGGRMVFAAAFAFAAARKSFWGIAVVAAQVTAYGCVGTAATGSKSEIMLPFIVLALVAILLRKSMPQRLLIGSLTLTTVMVLATVVIYPAMHQYRYVRNEVDLVSYLSQHSDEIGLGAGGKDVLRRLNGLEILTMVVTYQELGGLAPEPKSNYQIDIRALYGLPPGIHMSVGAGVFGGLLFIGGAASLLMFGSGLLGAGVHAIEGGVDLCARSHQLRAAMLGTLAIWIINSLNFSGNFEFVAKEAVAIVCTGVLLLVMVQSSEAMERRATARR